MMLDPDDAERFFKLHAQADVTEVETGPKDL
jgi:hypothetical protein